jgi:hypothetical protein
MSYAAAFSPDYATARSRFRAAASSAGAWLESQRIDARGPDGLELSIDAALMGGSDCRRVVVVSSGLHGVEGFAGSAVQAAWLEDGPRRKALPPDCGLIFLHGLNPFGFAWRRRTNEENVDLNRNFLLSGEPYAGAPPHYGELDRLFNPPSPPSRWDPFLLKALLAELRMGRGTLRQTLPVGQYEFPKGLFFGGRSASQTHRILGEQLPGWLPAVEDVLHLDLHTGLGPWASYRLWPSSPIDSPQGRWLRARFGRRVLMTAYPARGAWGSWCTARFANRNYRFATVEFGTYWSVRVVAALRAENRADLCCPPGDPRLARARSRLVEAFAPSDPRWRDAVVRQGLALLDRAVEAMDGVPSS